MYLHASTFSKIFQNQPAHHEISIAKVVGNQNYDQQKADEKCHYADGSGKELLPRSDCDCNEIFISREKNLNHVTVIYIDKSGRSASKTFADGTLLSLRVPHFFQNNKTISLRIPSIPSSLQLCEPRKSEEFEGHELVELCFEPFSVTSSKKFV